VTKGHPDKICDQISDAVLDELLRHDPDSKAAIECLITDDHVTIAGETKTEATINVNDIVKQTLRSIGYTNPVFGITPERATITNRLNEQSQEINNAVTQDDQGAGDQGMTMGYATNQTQSYLPLSIDLAHQLTKRLTTVRENNELDYLGPDGKAQVTIQHGQEPVISTVVLSAQHRQDVNLAQIREEILQQVIQPVCNDYTTPDTSYHINPSGTFTKGGPHADTGLTGRKIVVDTYGGAGRVGGGAFSGKDPSKIDRSAAYAARYIAKNIVAAGLASQCEVQIDYAIGVAEPVATTVNAFGTANISDTKIQQAIPAVFPVKPKNIIDELNLKQPLYEDTATNGHFGNDAYPWEQTNKADELRKHLI
jgi:S-adenosylmethionine synthetase